MNKIGILTLNGNFNFGNRLQNYALKTVIEKFGYKVETIWFITESENIKRILKNIYFKVFNKRKKISFINFSNEFLNIKYFKNKNIANDYKKIVVGSDQVWNYSLKGFNEDYFLDFSPYDKNIAYAASFGIDYIPDEYKNVFKKGLKNIKHISVREEKGKEIIDDLIDDKNVQVVVDPTMLLSKEEWQAIVKKPKNFESEKYIFVYFLGDISDEINKEINNFAEKNNCIVINVLDKENKYYNIGPQEFLFLIQNATLICTDSFHSCVFSIIFNKQFVVFERKSNDKVMYSRIETLLKKFELEEKKFNGKILKNSLNHNYDKTNKILEKEKKRCISFLENALK